MQIYKTKCLEHSVKKEILWTKLISKTKEQDVIFDKFWRYAWEF